MVPTTGASGNAFIVMSAPLSLPIVAGFELVTLILYAVPVGVSIGNVASMDPEVVPVNVPILKGDVKLPLASES